MKAAPRTDRQTGRALRRVAWGLALAGLLAGTLALAPQARIAPPPAHDAAALPLPMPPPATVETPVAATTAEPASTAGLLVAAGHGPEGRLIAVYRALAAGQGRAAIDATAALVRDHPNFALAQLLHADLLAARAGHPGALGQSARAAGVPEGADFAALREEAQRRLLALRERPPAGLLPREFARLSPEVRHAVAVDTSRSRLYLFSNDRQGLRLEQDFYVSLGKQGVDKTVEGDLRTPLGVYWITHVLPASRIDERFGRAALGLSYPNAWDKARGRTGTGLFVHGVPPTTLARAPWSTDGCVALANDDMQVLLDKLTATDTPVVISRRLEWVAPERAQREGAEFAAAWDEWERARRSGDPQQWSRWYDDPAQAQRPRTPAPDRGDASFVAWYGEGVPMMIVTARQHGAAPEAPGFVRQTWTRTEHGWRILDDIPVGRAALAAAEAAPKRPPKAATPRADRAGGAIAKAKARGSRAVARSERDRRNQAQRRSVRVAQR